MVEIESTKDLLLHLYQKNASKEKLLAGQITKNYFQLYGFLLNLVPRDPEINNNLWRNKLLKDFSPVDALQAEIYSLRSARKFGRAQKLQEVSENWINKLSESVSPSGHDFEKCLKFLLCLSNWENSDQIVLGSSWTIPVISPSIFKSEESWTPPLHGDSDLYKTSFCYTHYPDNLFENVQTVDSGQNDFSKIFETTPGRDLNGKTLFKTPDNTANSIKYEGYYLFGAIRNRVSAINNATGINLDLPILSDKQPDPFQFSLSERASNISSKKILTPSPEDEGFVDVESGISSPEQTDPTAIWEEVCRYKDTLPSRTWETRVGPPQLGKRKTLATTAGPEATNNVYLNYLHELQLMAGLSSGTLLPVGPLLTLGQLFSDVVHLLLGVVSDTFPYDTGSRKFFIKSSTYITGSTPETLGRLMEDFLECGALYVHLEDFSSGQNAGDAPSLGFVVQRFKEGISDYLQYYRGFILHVAETHGQSMLLFHRKILPIYKELRYLKDLCAGERNVQARIGLRIGLPKGLQLLTFLYEQTIKDWGGDNTYLLFFLLRCACSPYLVFLHNWLFEAKFYDPHSEYDIEMNEHFLSQDFGELFWQEGYKLKEKLTAVPFLGPYIAKAILVCGKSLNLLKICYPKHYLLDGRHQLRPSLSISLSQKDLKITEETSQAYYESINVKLEKPKETIVNKKIELKKCVDVTVPKKGVCVANIIPRGQVSVKETVVKETVVKETVDEPKINYSAKLKDLEDDINGIDEEFKRIESELIQELREEYEEMEDAEDRKIKLLKWQTKREGLHTEHVEILKTETFSEFKSTTKTFSSSETTSIHTERHSFTKGTRNVSDGSFNLINLSIIDDGEVCQPGQNVCSEINLESQALTVDESDMEDNIDLDSDSESLPTVRERITLSQPQLDNNIQEEEDLPQDDEIQLEDDEIQLEDDEIQLEDDEIQLEDNEIQLEDKEIQLEHNIEQDKTQEIESSMYKSLYLIHEPAPYEAKYTTFASCPSRDLFSIAKSASQIFSPDIENDEEDITSNKIPLPMLIQRSLQPPLLAQIRLVNKATLNFFNDKLKIQKHFEALRNFFFFQDGEFGHSISQLIFDKLSDGSHNLYNCLSNPFELLGILEAALCSSLPSSKEGSFSDNLFLVNSSNATDRDFSVTKYITLKYKVTWPLNIIITDTCLEKYNKIFSLLLRVKQVIWALTNCWYHLKKYDNKCGKLSGVLEFRRIQLFRHEMLHFIRSVHTHLCCQLLQVSWVEFQDTIKNKVKDLDELKNAHESYLNTALRRCLLCSDQEVILVMVENAFTLIQQFHLQVISLSWEQGRCCDERGFERVSKTRFDFLNYSLKIYKDWLCSTKC